MHLFPSPIEVNAGSLVFAGTHRRAESVSSHSHACPELILVNQGTCDVNVAGQALHLEPGDLLTMPAQEIHDQVSDEFIDTVYCGFVEPIAMSWTQPHVINLPDARFINTCMQLMAEVHIGKATACEYSLSGLLTAVLVQVNNHFLQQTHEKRIPTSLRTVMRYIEDNLSETLSVDILADRTRMSASNLHLLFRKHLETSPMRYLHDQRMKTARAALQSPYILIKEVAVLCGYRDVNYFVRIFRKAHGMSPGRWRQQQMENLDMRL